VGRNLIDGRELDRGRPVDRFGLERRGDAVDAGACERLKVLAKSSGQ
jgi:hypothetical protein